MYVTSCRDVVTLNILPSPSTRVLSEFSTGVKQLSVLLGCHSRCAAHTEVLSVAAGAAPGAYNPEPVGRTFFTALAACAGMRVGPAGDAAALSAVAKELRHRTAVALNSQCVGCPVTAGQLFELLGAQWIVTVDVMCAALQQLALFMKDR